MSLLPLDPAFPIEPQTAIDVGAVVLVNLFTPDKADEDAFLKVWQSNADFRTAFTHPEFRTKLSAYPSSAVASPHLFHTVAVPGICIV